MNAKKCDSAASFKYQVDAIQAQISLTETEESWDTIARGISTLKGLCEDGASDFSSEIIAAIRGVSRVLNSAMGSERTKLSGAAIDLVNAVASELGPAFEPLLPLFFPTLLTLCTRSNKVFITRARTCILAIIENTLLPSILTHLTQSLKDKSVSLRLASIEGVLACMNCFNPPDLEKDTRAREIEAAIRVTARDASADIRKASRKVFEAYKVLLPNRVDNFTSPLSPTMKKYLDIKSMNPPQQSLRLEQSHPAPPDPQKPELSSSSSRNAEPKVANTALSRSRPHNGHKPQAVRGSKDMPPPEFVPVRPTQPAGRAIVASRTSSNLHEHKRTVSASSVASTRSLVGSSVQPSRITPSASTGALTIGAQRLNAPLVATSTGVSVGPTRSLRPAVPPTSDARPSASEPVGGARRVPRPEPVQKPETSQQTKGARPTSRNDNTRTDLSTRSRPDLSTKSTKSTKPNVSTKPTTSTKPIVSTKPDASTKLTTDTARKASSSTIKVDEKAIPITAPDTACNVAKTGGVTQPTLSQLSRTKVAVVERKGEGVKKPAWGRPAPAPAPRKLGATTKPLSMKKKGHDTKKNEADKPVVIPEAVPLPPSPARTATEVPLPPSPTEGLKDIHEDAGPPTVEEVPEETGLGGDADSGNVYSEDAAVTPRLAAPSLLSGPPFVLDSRSSPTRTPISTLLTSIQRGFLFTPSSPLSPPQSYLPLGAGGEVMTDLAISFPLQAMMSRGAGFGFEHGTQKAAACEETNRPALSDVEVNKLAEC